MAAPYGGSIRLYTSKEARAFYDDIVREKQMPSMSSAFALAAAIGFLLDDLSCKVTKPQELMNVYSFDDSMLFEILVSWRFPDLEPKERLQYVLDYAESGVVHLRKHYQKYNGIDLSMLMKEIKGKDTEENSNQ